MPSQEYFQQSFLGGMNKQVDPTRLNGTEYALLRNGRVRKDAVKPINKAVNQRNLIPKGKIQGLYTAGSFAVIFIAGKAYVKDYEDPTSSFRIISDIQLEAGIDTVYGALVPASTMEYGRQLQSNVTSFITTNSSTQSVMKYGDLSGIVTAGSNAAGIFQDGVSQPVAVTTEANGFITQNFDQWSREKREYVPKGLQELESGGIFYIVAPDGRSIYRSVTGRPFDFTIAVDINGDKIAGGDASRDSIRVAFSAITCLYPAGTSVFVGTREASFLITPLEQNLIFGEPQFSKQYLFSSGPLNHFSIVDLNGDLGFIDYDGIRSFNYTQQTQTESNNTPLSAPVFEFFEDIDQTTTCCGDFDDYAFFACNTIYGYGVLVYDKTLEKFVSFDQYEGISVPIKQFAVIRTSTARRFFFITTDDNFYEAFAGTTTEQVGLYIGEWCTNNPSIEQKPMNLNCIFTNAKTAGTLTATMFVDRERVSSQSRAIEATISSLVIPQNIPFGASEFDSVQNISFNYKDVSHRGWKVGFLLEWDANAILSHVRCEVETNKQRNASIEQQARTFRDGI